MKRKDPGEGSLEKQEEQQPAASFSVIRPPKMNRHTATAAGTNNVDPGLADRELTIAAKQDLTWDFVLKEVSWLAMDFQKERQRHIGNAKKAGKALESYEKVQEAKKIKKQKDDAMALRRLASKMSRDVRKFWIKIDKVIAFKQKSEFDEIRQKAMDRHLVHLVKQTERYTSMLAENMLTGGTIGMSLQKKRDTKPRSGSHSGASDAEDSSTGAFLEADSEDAMSISRKGGYDSSGLGSITESDHDHSSSDEDFSCEADDPDDETTLIEEEARGREMAVEYELDVLKQDGDIPIEQLRAMYAGITDDDDMGGVSSNEAENDDDVNEDDDGSQQDTIVRDVATALRLGTSLRASVTATSQKKRVTIVETKRRTHEAQTDSETGTDVQHLPGDSISEDHNDHGSENADAEDDGDEEFIAEDEPDDETTLLEEEALGRDMAVDEELALLQREGDMSIEDLRAMYAGMADSENEDEDDGEDNDAAAEGDDDDKEEESEGNDCKVIQSKEQDSLSSDGAIIPKDAISPKRPSRTIASASPSGDSSDAEDDGDEEFIAEDEPDDETTLLAEEALGRDMAVDEELALLQREGDMSIEDLRAMYAGMADSENEDEDDGEDDDAAAEGDDDEEENKVEGDRLSRFDFKITSESTTAIVGGDGDQDDDDSDEFVIDENDDLPDDETTLIEEEARGREISVADELALLEQEGEMSIEALKAMYAGMSQEVNDSMGEEDDDDDDDDDDGDDEDEDEDIDKGNEEVESTSGVMDESSITGSRKDSHQSNMQAVADTKAQQPTTGVEDTVEDALTRLEAADMLARSVHVDRPFLLAKSLLLREYQHVGLNWLVSLHERRLNGILADEMGLGKTIQTIALLAYLAAFRGLWGPHLIVVPTSCIVNWETEFKKWCPAFKVLTYYGSAKTRKQLRTGWSKLNSFHICITSYQLVVQDANSFRRKRWYYMILDEAHNIKNFKSQRWQTLLNFNTQRRLLLTGTPLQNNLMELWSLMHFLMPHIFRSRKEFSYWFSNPLNSMVEGNRSVNSDLIVRLHAIMRPFLLRRLKKDVAKQLPAKYEHIVTCKLSKRQMFLYEEFMSRSSTRASLTGGSYLGMMNILMQLRKVCNHPDLFEPRPIISPFAFPAMVYHPSVLVARSANDIRRAAHVWCGPAAGTQSALHMLSTSWLHLWSFEEDSLARDYVAMAAPSPLSFVEVDDVNLSISLSSSSLRAVNTNQHYANFLQAFKEAEEGSQRAVHAFNSAINARRTLDKCALSLSWRTVQAASVELKMSIAAKTRHCHRTNLHSVSGHLWKDLVLTTADRAEACQDLVSRFVFILPMAVSPGPQLPNACVDVSFRRERERLCAATKPSFDDAMEPFYEASMRQRIFFPDRKLVQFDSGKLQTLCTLLRDLKRGGHKCLIFTQMSKMLDILETFLNLNGHTYVRLDGSTGIDKRQKLMDRFNSDPKLFCFILSTRSGGLGINLTGADTVIFYDSDWNPAMDAQAQDRAHRIGQTREVHIYRLVSGSTVEENVLIKAKQKRQLDFLVMTEGNFSEESLFTAQSLKDMLGGPESNNNNSHSNTGSECALSPRSNCGDVSASMSKQEMEAAMNAVEDDDDVVALRTARAEAAMEDAEFDDDKPTRLSSASASGEGEGEEGEGEGDVEGDEGETATEQKDEGNKAIAPVGNEEKDAEEEFSSWQATLGFDFQALERALKPIERYGLRLHTDIEPYYSMFFINEQYRLQSLAEDKDGYGNVENDPQWDIEAIEREKEEEEYRALSEGELLAANLTRRDVVHLKRWFHRERSRRKQEHRQRVLSGAGWVYCIDPISLVPFWFNDDTHEMSYQQPKAVTDRLTLEHARVHGFGALPLPVLVHILGYLVPYPDRMQAMRVCMLWRQACRDPSFLLRVWPVEYQSDDSNSNNNSNSDSNSNSKVNKRLSLAGKNTYLSLRDALEAAQPGDTLVLHCGHHWDRPQSGKGQPSTLQLVVDKPLQILSEGEDGQLGQGDCGRCVVELAGQIVVSPSARRVMFSGLTVRRARKSSRAMHGVVVSTSALSIFNCVVNNEGARGSTVVVRNGGQISAYATSFRGGFTAGILSFQSKMLLSHCSVSHNIGSGLINVDSNCSIGDSRISSNGRFALEVFGEYAHTTLVHCEARGNASGTLHVAPEVDRRLIVCRSCITDGDHHIGGGIYQTRRRNSGDNHDRSLPAPQNKMTQECDGPSSTPPMHEFEFAIQKKRMLAERRLARESYSNSISIRDSGADSDSDHTSDDGNDDANDMDVDTQERTGDSEDNKISAADEPDSELTIIADISNNDSEATAGPISSCAVRVLGDHGASLQESCSAMEVAREN